MKWGLIDVLIVILVLVFFGGLLIQDAATAWGQAAPAGLKTIPGQGYTPDSFVVTALAKPDALVCAEPAGGGTVACRTVAEFRTWVRERKAR